jgi:hypothetical protein
LRSTKVLDDIVSTYAYYHVGTSEHIHMSAQSSDFAYDVIMDSMSTVFSDVAECISEAYGIDQDGIIDEMNKVYMEYSGGTAKIKKKAKGKTTRVEQIAQSIIPDSFANNSRRSSTNTSRFMGMRGEKGDFGSTVIRKMEEIVKKEDEDGEWIPINDDLGEKLFWNKEYGIGEEFLIWSPDAQMVKYLFKGGNYRSPTEEDKEKFKKFKVDFLIP